MGRLRKTAQEIRGRLTDDRVSLRRRRFAGSALCHREGRQHADLTARSHYAMKSSGRCWSTCQREVRRGEKQPRQRSLASLSSRLAERQGFDASRSKLKERWFFPVFNVHVCRARMSEKNLLMAHGLWRHWNKWMQMIDRQTDTEWLEACVILC